MYSAVKHEKETLPIALKYYMLQHLPAYDCNIF